MSDALYRLKLAIDDLTTATIARDKNVALYLLKTEIAEALHALESDTTIDEDLLVDLLIAVATVEQELER